MGHLHRVRGPLNAAVLRALDGATARTVGEHKRALLGDLPDLVVEIGAGTGATTRYLRPGTRLVAIEPNVAMHHALAHTCRHRGVHLDLVPAVAEQLPLRDASVDVIVSSLVLCTVPDPVGAVAEARRVLRPGGRLVFLEHVAAPDGTPLARAQQALRRPWHWCGEGCDLRRDTEATLRAAGFASLEVAHVALAPGWVPISPAIAGTATR